MKRFLTLLLAATLLFTAALPLTSCALFPLTETKLRSNVEKSVPERKAEEGVAGCLKYWGFPKLDTVRLNEAETAIRTYAWKKDELGTAEELARKCALLYLDSCFGQVDTSQRVTYTNAMIRCLVGAIDDPYAKYRTAEEYAAFSAEMSGSFVGIGITVAEQPGEGLLINAVSIGSTAESAGILVGDLIVGVDGNSYESLGYDAALAAIRGEEGTEITVSILRGTTPLSFTLLRATVADNTLTYRIEDQIGIITVKKFKSNTGTQFVAAMDILENEQVSGIVFDLRSNPGGYLTAASQMLSYLVPEGTDIVSYAGTTEKSTDAHVLTVPCAVLVNASTASASELFAAALRDYTDMQLLDATVIGQKTYGKGIMQNSYGFSDGGVLVLTVSTYEPPSGINFHGVGVTPDVELGESADALAEAMTLLQSK